MPETRAPARSILWVYVAVCIGVFAVTRLESLPGIGPYVHLAVAAIFLLTAIRLTRSDPAHYGVALGGLMEPANDGRPVGPLGLFDLGRALLRAAPSAVTETLVAFAIAAVVFPLYAAAYYWWSQPADAFSLTLPPRAAGFALAQLIVVALPEETFFRGYLQTSLADIEGKRIGVLRVKLAPLAWVTQAALFAFIHFVVDPNPARLAVFFPALLFGWTRAWRGGVGAAVMLHAMSNLYSEILGRSWL